MPHPRPAAPVDLVPAGEQLFAMGEHAPTTIGDWLADALARLAVLSAADRDSAVESIRTVLGLAVRQGGLAGCCDVRVSTWGDQVRVRLVHRPNPSSDEGSTRLVLFRRIGLGLGDVTDGAPLLTGS